MTDGPRRDDDWEPQRFLGVPRRPDGRWRIDADSTEPRVFGVPRSWLAVRVPDLRWLRHPVRWTRWRLDVRRRGAYAPTFEECARSPQRRQR